MKNFLTIGILALGLSAYSLASTYQQPEDVVSLYFEYLQAGDLSGLSNLLDENIIWHQPGNNVLSGTYVGKAQVLQLFGRFMQISEGTFKIDQVLNIMRNGNFVSATLSFSASRCQYLRLTMQMTGVDIMRVEDGFIKEVILFSQNQDAEDRFWGKGQFSGKL